MSILIFQDAFLIMGLGRGVWVTKLSDLMCSKTIAIAIARDIISTGYIFFSEVWPVHIAVCRIQVCMDPNLFCLRYLYWIHMVTITYTDFSLRLRPLSQSIGIVE